MKRYVCFMIALSLLSGCGGGSSSSEVQQSLALSDMGVTTPLGVYYPDFDPNILHYAATCGDEEPVMLSFSSFSQGVDLSVNGTEVLMGAQHELEGLTGDHDIVVELTKGDRSQTYFIHCIPAEFPEFALVKKTDEVDSGFLITAARIDNTSYLLVLDNNAVPRLRKAIEGRVSDFKLHDDGRYSYAIKTVNNEFGKPNNEIVVLDAHFQEIKRLSTISLNQTDSHDFLITSDGTYILMAYNSSYRDMRPWGLSENELTRDSVIQEQNDQGEVIFEWNSWDHVDVNSCLNHRFPDDYAHLNSMQVAADGNLIISLRGCSLIMKIDRSLGSGDAIWEVGGSNPTFQIVGDSFEEFCGQHTASVDSEGRLYIFDNGGHCNGDREQNYGLFSRALVYSLDLESSQAVFFKDYSFNGTYSEYSISGGSFLIASITFSAYLKREISILSPCIFFA